MVKINVTPPVVVMAIHAPCFGVIFFIQTGYMDIFMTINALFANLPEAPSVCLLVTGKTGRCKMGSFKLERSKVMLFNGKV